MDEFEALEGVESEELFEHFRFKVDKGQGLLRIDKFLHNRIENSSRNRIQKTAESGSILVNGSPVKSNYRVKPEDEITIVLPTAPREIELIPQNIPINVVFEDDDLVIINKDAGMVVHPGYGNYTGTLVNALLYHFDRMPKKVGAEYRPGLVHRIDKNTTGLMVVAKSEHAMNVLAREFFDRTIQRNYIALVWGDPDAGTGIITGNIGRNIRDRKIMQVFEDGSQGKPAVTHYKVIERFGYVTLVECKLETGRTHQIRVHFKHIGHPLFNDITYGGNKILKGTTFSKYRQFVENCFSMIPEQALHAKSLGFLHPVTRQQIHFEAEVPEGFRNILEKWRNYADASISGGS